MHATSAPSFYKALERTVAAINETYPFEFPWGDDAELRKLADQFHRLSGFTVPDCVLALDGLAVKIRKPSLWDTSNPMHYFCRKGFYAVNCQAGCDAQLRFRFCSMKTCGSTHDSTAFKTSDLAAKLDAGDLPSQYYMVGDDAYSDGAQLLTPVPGRGLTSNEDAYNFYQSK